MIWRSAIILTCYPFNVNTVLAQVPSLCPKAVHMPSPLLQQLKPPKLQDQDYANVTCRMRVPWFVLIIPKHVNSALNDAHLQLDPDFLPIQDLV